MSVTPEEIAAFADGELDPARHAEVAAQIAADPHLAEQVRAHRALRERLARHFASALEAPLPESVTRLIDTRRGTVVDLAPARERREQRKGPHVPHWSWIAGPALAASLALAVFLPRGAGDDYAEGPLARALDQQLVATQGEDTQHRILLSFRDESGAYCRAFTSEERSGIACREQQGWHLRATGPGAGPQASEYRMADNPSSQVLEQAQSMAAGPALDSAQERGARAQGWR